MIAVIYWFQRHRQSCQSVCLLGSPGTKKTLHPHLTPKIKESVHQVLKLVVICLVENALGFHAKISTRGQNFKKQKWFKWRWKAPEMDYCTSHFKSEISVWYSAMNHDDGLRKYLANMPGNHTWPVRLSCFVRLLLGNHILNILWIWN